MHTRSLLCQWNYCIPDLCFVSTTIAYWNSALSVNLLYTRSISQWIYCILDLFRSEAIVYSISVLTERLLHSRLSFVNKTIAYWISALSVKVLYTRSLFCQSSYCPFVLMINVMINHYSCLCQSHVNTLFRLIKNSKLKWYNKIPKRLRYGIFIESFFSASMSFVWS